MYINKNEVTKHVKISVQFQGKVFFIIKNGKFYFIGLKKEVIPILMKINDEFLNNKYYLLIYLEVRYTDFFYYVR